MASNVLVNEIQDSLLGCPICRQSYGVEKTFKYHQHNRLNIFICYLVDFVFLLVIMFVPRGRRIVSGE
jgi:t-SNARE complex subunit (syntaxin)